MPGRRFFDTPRMHSLLQINDGFFEPAPTILFGALDLEGQASREV
jgi:hypothetical protein